MPVSSARPLPPEEALVTVASGLELTGDGRAHHASRRTESEAEEESDEEEQEEDQEP